MFPFCRTAANTQDPHHPTTGVWYDVTVEVGREGGL